MKEEKKKKPILLTQRMLDYWDKMEIFRSDEEQEEWERKEKNEQDLKPEETVTAQKEGDL